MQSKNEQFLSCANGQLVNAMIDRVIANPLIKDNSRLKRNCIYLLHEWSCNHKLINGNISVFYKGWNKINNSKYPLPNQYENPEAMKIIQGRSYDNKVCQPFMFENFDDNKENISKRSNSNPFNIVKKNNNKIKKISNSDINNELNIGIYHITEFIFRKQKNFEEIENKLNNFYLEFIERKLTGNKDRDLEYILGTIRKIPSLLIESLKDLTKKSRYHKRDIVSQSIDFVDIKTELPSTISFPSSKISLGSVIFDTNKINNFPSRESFRSRINDTMKISKKDFQDNELPEYEDLTGFGINENEKFSNKKEEENILKVENEWFNNIPDENIWDPTPIIGYLNIKIRSK